MSLQGKSLALFVLFIYELNVNQIEHLNLDI